MGQIELEKIPEGCRICLAETQRFESIGRQEAYNRLRPGDANELTWSIAPNAGPGPRFIKIVDARSLTIDGRKNWTDWQLETAQLRAHGAVGADAKADNKDERGAHGAASPSDNQALLAERQPDLPSRPRQLPLLAQQIGDIAMLRVPEWAQRGVYERLKAIRCGANGDYRAAGFSTREPWRRRLADELGISYRHYMRLSQKYHATKTRDCPQGDASILIDKEPGRVRGKFSILTPWMRDFLTEQHLGGLNKKQCYSRLLEEINRKQAAWGAAHIYQIPSDDTVNRFLRGLDPITNAVAGGKAAAVKNACGYLDRSFEDVAAGEMWVTDEWNIDAACFEDKDARRFYRPWVICLMDARSKFILHWVITRNPNAEAVLDLVEGAVRKHGRPDYFYSDKGGHFRGRLGRSFAEIDREKMLGPASSILEQLGTVRKGPGEEKNPRGNPIERRHRIFADQARLLPTWSGANTDERPDRFDAAWEQHKQWIRGKATTTGLIPLSEIAAWFSDVVEKYNHAPSAANGLLGLSPAAGYQQFSTDEERALRVVEPGDLTLAFAENFSARTVMQGGIIQLPDGLRYSHPALLFIQGQARDIKRARHDKSFICVIQRDKSEELIVAPRRQRVGIHDSNALAQQSELLASIRKTISASIAIPPRAVIASSPRTPSDPAVGVSSPEPSCSRLNLHEVSEMTVEE